MALVVRNNNRTVMAKAAMQVIPSIGAVAFSATGQKLLWDGVKYIAAKGAQMFKNARGKKNKNRDLVVHPGALPGAVAAPIAISRVIRGSKPKFIRSRGAVTVSHRELIGQFNSTSPLVVNGGVGGNLYRVNPSNPLLFPWLQSISTNFDQYKFDNLRLQYVPMCATTETGRVALYFDKDSEDPEPVDRIELANMAHLTETAPWCEASLQIPVDNIKRYMNDNSTADLKLIDLGQVGIATYGGPGTNVVGDLFIHYTVTFFEPQPSAGVVDTDQSGTGSADFGPALVSVVSSALVTDISFRSPGTFLVFISQRNTTVTSTVATAGTLNTATTVQAVGFYGGFYNFTAAVPGAKLTINGTGMGNYTLNVMRARVANTVNLI
jgi:hypothetical protein